MQRVHQERDEERPRERAEERQQDEVQQKNEYRECEQSERARVEQFPGCYRWSGIAFRGHRLVERRRWGCEIVINSAVTPPRVSFRRGALFRFVSRCGALTWVGRFR